MASDPPIRVTTDDLEALQKISAWIVHAYPTLARVATGDLKPLGVVSRDDYNAATDTIRELEEVINGADHKTAKYWRRAQAAERECNLAESRMHAAEKRATKTAAVELESLADRARTMQGRAGIADTHWAAAYIAGLKATETEARSRAAKLRGEK